MRAQRAVDAGVAVLDVKPAVEREAVEHRLPAGRR